MYIEAKKRATEEQVEALQWDLHTARIVLGDRLQAAGGVYGRALLTSHQALADELLAGKEEELRDMQAGYASRMKSSLGARIYASCCFSCKYPQRPL